MKKLLTFALALMLVLSLAACGGKTDPAPSDSGGTADPGTSQQEPSSTPDSSKPADSTPNNEPSSEVTLTDITDFSDADGLPDWAKKTLGTITACNIESDSAVYKFHAVVDSSGVSKSDVDGYVQYMLDNGATEGTDTKGMTLSFEGGHIDYYQGSMWGLANDGFKLEFYVDK